MSAIPLKCVKSLPLRTQVSLQIPSRIYLFAKICSDTLLSNTDLRAISGIYQSDTDLPNTHLFDIDLHPNDLTMTIYELIHMEDTDPQIRRLQTFVRSLLRIAQTLWSCTTPFQTVVPMAQYMRLHPKIVVFFQTQPALFPSVNTPSSSRSEHSDSLSETSDSCNLEAYILVLLIKSLTQAIQVRDWSSYRFEKIVWPEPEVRDEVRGGLCQMVYEEVDRRVWGSKAIQRQTSCMKD